MCVLHGIPPYMLPVMCIIFRTIDLLMFLATEITEDTEGKHLNIAL